MRDGAHAGIYLWSQHLPEWCVQDSLGQACDMVGDAFADEEHAEVVREVVTVVCEEIVAFGRVHLLQALQVLQYGLHRKMSGAHWYDLHRSAMMRGAWIAGLHAGAVEVFDVVEDQSCMIHCIYLYSYVTLTNIGIECVSIQRYVFTKKLSAHRPGHASGEVVYIELDFHTDFI